MHNTTLSAGCLFELRWRWLGLGFSYEHPAERNRPATRGMDGSETPKKHQGGSISFACDGPNASRLLSSDESGARARWCSLARCPASENKRRHVWLEPVALRFAVCPFLVLERGPTTEPAAGLALAGCCRSILSVERGPRLPGLLVTAFHFGHSLPCHGCHRLGPRAAPSFLATTARVARRCQLGLSLMRSLAVCFRQIMHETVVLISTFFFEKVLITSRFTLQH